MRFTVYDNIGGATINFSNREDAEIKVSELLDKYGAKAALVEDRTLHQLIICDKKQLLGSLYETDN